MKDCDHYEGDGGIAAEKGQPVDHCETCRELAAADQRIHSLLRDTAPEAPPESGWQAEVFAATRRKSPARRWWLPVLAIAVATAAMVLFLRGPGRPDGLQISIEHGATRSGTPPANEPSTIVARGDRVDIIAPAAPATDGGYAGLWIYRDGALALRCDTDCERDGNLVHSLEIGLGDYDILFVREAAAPPDSTGELGADYEAAKSRGATIERRHLEAR